MNIFFNYAKQNNHSLLNKYKNYFNIYHRYLSKFIKTRVNVLEFGVGHGGSLQMWKECFGPKAQIYGVDINPDCKQLEEGQIHIFIGDQGNKTFLRSLKKHISTIDILIDDGGHEIKQQITTFEEFFPYINNNGVYICEDLHTSYMKEFRGGYKKDTFIEYSKNLIDQMNAWFSEDPDKLKVTDLTKSMYSIHYYNSVLVIEKQTVQKGVIWVSGKPRIPSLFTSSLAYLSKNSPLRKDILDVEKLPNKDKHIMLKHLMLKYNETNANMIIETLITSLEDEEAFDQLLIFIKSNS